MILEICANNFTSALNAQKAGAHRIELCCELNVGGITPSYDLLTSVAEKLTIETFVLVRPRAGDFNYSNTEFEQMKQTIETCKNMGFSGIVSGILKADLTLDQDRTKELVEWARPLSFTFHRAFDEVVDPKHTFEELKEIGVDRLLTSGQQPTALEGLDMLIELNKSAGNDIIVMPGSGINVQNAKHFQSSGFKEIHTSATKKTEPQHGNNNELISDIRSIKSLLEIIND